MLESSSSSRGHAPRASAIAGRGSCVFLALLALVGCEDDAVVEVKGSTGVIEVTALAVGPYPDSFNVLLNNGRLGSVVPNGVFSIPVLTRGNYQVALLEEADNCWYGVNARIVTVVPNDTSFTTFLVRCK